MSTDPRHQRRIDFMQTMFAYDFHPQDEKDNTELQEILIKLPQIDARLHELAPERPLSEINKVDLAILRIIMFEWEMSQTPKKVLIDEGVELAKEFGTDSSPRFVNGVLAQLLN